MITSWSSWCKLRASPYKLPPITTINFGCYKPILPYWALITGRTIYSVLFWRSVNIADLLRETADR